MKNLAGHQDATQLALLELQSAGATVSECKPEGKVEGEVKSRVMGHAGSFALTRAWVYWVAEGYMPIELAERLDTMPRKAEGSRYSGHGEAPIMGDVVRIDGDMGGKRIAEGFVSIDVEGRKVVLDPKHEQRSRFAALAKGHDFIARAAANYVWVDTEEEAARLTVARFIETYHIDTEEGLAAFVEIARGITAPACYLKYRARKEQRLPDAHAELLLPRDWFGALTVGNVEQVAKALRGFLCGARYTFVAARAECRHAPEVRTGQRLNADHGRDPIVVHRHSNAHVQITISDTYGVASLATAASEPPYISFERRQVKITHRVPCGDLVHWIYALEPEERHG